MRVSSMGTHLPLADAALRPARTPVDREPGVVSQAALTHLTDERTRMFARLFAPTLEVQAHCDLPCGVYDPAQARIEAESIKAHHRQGRRQRRPGLPHPRHPDQGAARRAGQAPPVGAVDRLLQAAALREVPAAAPLVNEATKLAGASGAKGTLDAKVADDLLAKIDEIAEIFWETKKS